MRFKTLLAAIALTWMTASAHAQTVIAIPQDGDFFEANMRWNGATAKGYDGRMALKDVKGKLAFCGVGVVTNIQLVRAIHNGLRGGTVKVNGKTVVKNFSFFAKAKSARALNKTKANCIVTSVAVPKRSDKLDIRYGDATFRN